MTPAIGRRHMLRQLRWSVVEQLGRQLFALITFLIVARLIGPDEYGKFGLAYAPVALCQALVSHNLGDQIIHAQRVGGKSVRLADNIFWLTGLTGVLLSLMLAGISAFVLPPKDVTEASRLLLYLSPIVCVVALSTVPNAILQASLQFRAIALGVFGAGVIASSVSIAMAFAGYGAWSLVAQVLLQQSMIATIAFFWAGWRPGLDVDVGKIREVLAHVSAAASRNALQSAEPLLARLLIGPVAGLGTAGYVTLSQRIHNLAFQLTALPAARIYFVRWVSSSGQQGAPPVAAARLMTRLLIVVTPGVLVLTLLSSEVLWFALGPQWQSAAPILALVSLSIIPNVMIYIIHTLARSRNQLAPFLRIQLVQVVGYVIAIAAGLPYGVTLALALGVMANFCGCLWQILLAVRISEFPGKHFGACVLKIGVAALCASVILKLATITTLGLASIAAITASCAYAALIITGFPDLRKQFIFGRDSSNAK